MSGGHKTGHNYCNHPLKQWANNKVGKSSGSGSESDLPFPNVRLNELGLEGEHRSEVEKWGDQYPPVPGNPPSLAKGHEAEWERAKKAVEPYWDRYSDPWAVVVYVFKKIAHMS